MLLFFSALLLSPPLCASELVYSGTAHDNLFAVDFEGDTGYAVGAHGLILRSVDAGRSWQAETSPTPLALLGVAVSAGRAIAVGQLGTVLVRDSASGWRQVDSGSRERLLNVDMNPGGLALAVGAFGSLLRSVDAGVSWQSASPSFAGLFEDPDMRLGAFFTPSLYGLQLLDDGRAWVCGELGLILHSADGGLNWQPQRAGISSMSEVSPTLSAMSMHSDGSGHAVGQGGLLLATADAGQQWQTLSSPTQANLLGLARMAGGQLAVSGMREMLLSTDAGASWHSLAAELTSGWLQGLAAVANGQDDMALVAVGQQAHIRRWPAPQAALQSDSLQARNQHAYPTLR